jgi:hypothetical protein
MAFVETIATSEVATEVVPAAPVRRNSLGNLSAPEAPAPVQKLKGRKKEEGKIERQSMRRALQERVESKEIEQQGEQDGKAAMEISKTASKAKAAPTFKTRKRQAPAGLPVFIFLA